MYDINLYTIHIVNNIDRDSLPGMIAMQPLKRPARGRENDTLIALITLNGSSTITPESLQSWMEKKGEEYYRTQGTVTFAMRSLMEKINRELLDRNLKRAKTGAQITAIMNLAVIKRGVLYLANAGATRSFFISDQENLALKDDGQSRELGLNESLTIRFSQKEIKENDLLLLASLAPESWTEDNFAGANSLSIEGISRRLFNQSGTDIKAILLKFIPGKGTISINPMKRNTAAASSLSEEKMPEVQPEFSAAQTEPLPIAPVIPDGMNNEPERPVQTPQENVRVPDRIERSARPPEKTLESHSIQKPVLLSPQAKVAIGKTARTTVDFWQASKEWLTQFLRRMLPGLTDAPVKLNKPVLIFIALVVPLTIALIATGVYVNKGKGREFNAAVVQAQQYAILADTQASDEPSRLASLQQAMFWLEKAATYGSSDTMDTLTLQVQTSLDQLQGVLRLELTPLFSGSLPGDAKITQMVATNTDVYLLDDTSGTVLRYFRTGNEYFPDEKFDCGLNPDNPLSPIGKLVDMVPVPVANQFQATIMVIDGAGVIEYCIPGEAGITGSLTPPDAGWVTLKSISLFQDYLYVLDTGGHAVYRYTGSGIQFSEKPSFFFDQIVPDLTDAFDIEVNGYELYVLKTNGQMIECTYSPLKDYKETECFDPAPYGDMRTGAEAQTISFPEANFVQMRMTAAPDSSLYLLDAKSKAVYHFSLQRNLQKILHPRLKDGTDIERLTPTAVAISSGRLAFVAFGNLVYYSPLP